MADDALIPAELRSTLEAIANHLGRIGTDLTGTEARVCNMDGRLTTIETRLNTVGRDLDEFRAETAEPCGRVFQPPMRWNLGSVLIAIKALALAGQVGILFLVGRVPGRVA